MVTRRGFLVLLGTGGAIGAASLVGIQLLPGESKPSGEPLIRYGSENCARCRMTISDPRFAAAWREPSGSELHFDDIGCMVLMRREKNPADGSRFWVHDYTTEAWLDALTSAYVISEAIHTPMSYGIAATATTDAAQRILPDSHQVQVVEWETVGSALERRG